MLINQKEPSHVKFLEYTGKWPNLCSGSLKLEIDGETAIFTSYGDEENGIYPKFWTTGGSCSLSDIQTAEWIIDANKIPEKFREYAEVIDRVFNENVEHGCCGGCR